MAKRAKLDLTINTIDDNNPQEVLNNIERLTDALHAVYTRKEQRCHEAWSERGLNTINKIRTDYEVHLVTHRETYHTYPDKLKVAEDICVKLVALQVCAKDLID
jgi:hypothetical protein